MDWILMNLFWLWRASELRKRDTQSISNWFTPYGLEAELARDGFTCFDRFDLVDTSDKAGLAKLIVRFVRAIPLLRWFGFLCTPGTLLVGVKPAATRG